ncbi:HAUS augmin-like complex subunit 6 [Hetaerina americana]|uniref:HAUS augmin-like complex subunit 6 n=1 Tax=Hetaerina americana TaxID=62018 RepID=UPI003A7F1DCA
MAKPSPVNYHKLFHRNMLALTTFNSTTKALKNCFKEGIFSCPNQEGFAQVSYFLINIIYPGTKAFRNCWPILDKSQERAFRAALIDLIRGLKEDFDDIYPMSYVVPARLMSPGGDRFVKIMWELSMLALGVHAKREAGNTDCFFFNSPPSTTPQHLRKQGVLIWKAHTRKNLEECEAKLSKLEDIMKIFKELKGISLDRMLIRDKKMREIESSLVKLLKESDLGNDLVSKLLDLKNEDGILELEEKVKQENTSIDNVLKHWENISSLAGGTKEILDAAIKQKSDNCRLVLNASECATSTDPTENAVVVNTSCDVSLLEHLSGIHDRLKALKSVTEEISVSGCLNTWQSISEEKELVESDMRKMESGLELEMFKLNSHSNENSVQGVSEFQVSSSLIERSGVNTSTPIKNNSSISTDAGLNSSLNITPHQPATSSDFFSIKLADIHRDILDEKVKKCHQKVTNSKTNDSSIDELLERFRKIVEIREQRSAECI